MTPAIRAARKNLVFPIMYGHCPQATLSEMREWRRMAGDYIDGKRDHCPFTLEHFRAIRKES